VVDFKQLDFPTRAGLVASVTAILGVLIPPISVASALVAIAFSGTAWWRAHQRGEANPVARLCLLGCVALVTLIIVGSALYNAAS
jgi:hypothetical protein